MENEVPMSQPPMPLPEQQQQEGPSPGYPDIEAMKAQARELAIQQVLASRVAVQVPPQQPVLAQPKIIYLRRNLTVAELIVVFAIACGLVYGIPSLWKFTADRIPQIEIKVK